MLQTRESNACDWFSGWKSLVFLAEKYGELSWRLLKGTLGLFLLSSFLFISYAIIASQMPWKCPECDRYFDESAGNISRRHTPPASETNISHILFGIGGSAGTWSARRHYSELWWKPGETRGFAWLDERPNYTWPSEGPPFRVSEDTSRFPYTSGGSRSAVRLARIFLESVRAGERGVRWYVIGDDDTVFFTENLVSILGKYDHEEMYYIGGISESVEQDVMHSYEMGFGGGGFAISARLAVELERVFDGCLNRYGYFYGSDQRVGACVSELGVPLTRETGFHQVDIRGDAYGLLAAHPVAPLVSLHHLDYVKPLVPWRSQLDSLESIVDASRTDPGRVLQQAFAYDAGRKWSVSVSWGYTAQIFPWIVTPKDLGTPLQTFLTWRSWRPEPFTFNTRPWGAEPCQQPLLYFLERVEEVGAGRGSLSVYKRDMTREVKLECDRRDYVEALKVERVEVLAPKMAHNEWQQAPRRYCAEIDRPIKHNRSILVKIRKCRIGESTSPP